MKLEGVVAMPFGYEGSGFLDFPLLDLLHSCPDPIWCIRTADRKWMFLTLGMEELLRMPIPDFLVRFNLGMVIHPDDVGAFNAFLEEAQSDGKASAEVRMIRGDQSEVWVALRAVGHRDESGVCKYLVGIAQDVSELRRYQEELRRSELKWKTVLDNAGEAFLTVDRGGRITYVNKSFETMLGYGRDRIVGESLWTLVPEDQRSIIDYQWSLRNIRWQRRYEIELLRSDGSRIPVRIIATVVRGFSNDTEDYLHFGFIDDLTKVRRIDREQKDQLKFLKTLLDTIPSPVFYKDSRGRYQGFNRAFQELFGLCDGDFQMEPGSLPEEFVARDVSSDMELLKKPGSMSFDFSMGSGEDRRDFVIRKASFFDHCGKVGGFVGVMTEVTSMKRMERVLRESKERAEASSRAKMAFVSHISHEIRTPMNAVVGLSEVLLEECRDQGMRKDLELIHQASSSLMDILGDILDLAAVEAGKLKLETVPFSIEEVCSPIFSLMWAEAEKKGLDFVHRIDPSAQGLFLGDPVRVRQLLWNLLSNAVKFTDRGSVSTQITWKDGGVLFVVSDTGVGIDEAHLDRIFGYFERGEDLLTRRLPGTGLGLALCKSLVSLMGGTIGVKSRKGEGSEFSFWLPLERAEGVPLPRKEEDAPELPKGLKVLLAEDNRANQRLMTTVLRRMNLEVTTASDGEEALKLFEQEGPFDMVLMDVQMPVMDGLEVTRRIRSSEKGTGRRTLVVGLTAFSSPEDRKACVEAGMDRFLAKPVSPARLRRELGRIWAFTSEEKSLIDPEVLLEMADGSRDLAKGFASDVLEMLPGYVSSLEGALESGSSRQETEEAVEKSLHRLKGTAGYLGAASLESELSNMLRRWRCSEKEEVLAALPGLIDKIRKLEEDLKRYLGSEA
ncbi:MAG: PAS domain S-box protein [Thermanaerothrix sp.]|nr:PAS domain S-box protein [Thermanaerothrix sp.]